MTRQESKRIVKELHKKYYGNKDSSGKKSAKRKVENARIAEAVSPVLANKSRNDLMLEAKAKGIKNFRILNKAELGKVLDPNTTQQEREATVKEAVKRWKAGWSKNKAAEGGKQ